MSVYPGAVDTFTVPGGSATLGGSTPTHTALHTAETGAIVAIQNTLGVNPQGAFASVAARLAGLAAVASSGSATDLTAGTLADARLSSNVPLKNAGNSFVAGQTIGNTQLTTASGYNCIALNGAASLTSSTGIYSLSSDQQLYLNAPTGATVRARINGVDMLVVSATAAVLGTDPGGSELLRVGGSARFLDDAITLRGHRTRGAVSVGVTANEGVSDYAGGDGFRHLACGADTSTYGILTLITASSNASLYLRGLRLQGTKLELMDAGGAVTIGTDPGGSELLRSTGNMRFGPMLTDTLAGNARIDIRSPTSDDGVYCRVMAPSYRAFIGTTEAGVGKFAIGNFGRTFDECDIMVGPTYETRVRVDNTSVGGETPLILWDVSSGLLKRVTRGDADSGGTGYRVLRIAN